MMTIEDRKKGGLDGGRLGRNWKLRHIRDGGCLVLSRYELGDSSVRGAVSVRGQEKR